MPYGHGRGAAGLEWHGRLHVRRASLAYCGWWYARVGLTGDTVNTPSTRRRVRAVQVRLRDTGLDTRQ